MLSLTRIVGSASDPVIEHRLHHLQHAGRLETLWLSADDTRRHRLRLRSDAGTDCAIALDRQQHLFNGAVLMLDGERAIVVRMQEQQWLRLSPRDARAALELGYFAGNMHWSVRFDGEHLLLEMAGAEADYLERLAPMLADGRVQRGTT